MEVPVLALAARLRDRLSGPRARNPASLCRREHRPADLVDVEFTPRPVPVPDPAESLPGLVVDDLEETSFRVQVAGVAVGDLLRAFGPAEVLHHRRVA